MRQATSVVLMIEPVAFRENPDSARTNHFVRGSGGLDADELQSRALAEFRGLVSALRREGVEVLVRKDALEPHTPDSIFPNNWVSFHADGRVVLYPMEPATRRGERRAEILDWLRDEGGFHIADVVDLTRHEHEGRFLEGTGSMVFDRRHRVLYACLSPRTSPSLLEEWGCLFEYRVVPFHARDARGAAIYHTNVLMSVGRDFAVLCSEAIPEASERERVLGSLRETGHDVLDVSMEQLHDFVGNLLELEDTAGKRLIALSERALHALSTSERRTLEAHARLVSSPIPTIEDCGGGSVRCMLAEIFLPRRT